MKVEETERGFRISFGGDKKSDLQKLKSHFFDGFMAAMLIGLEIYHLSDDIHKGHSCWVSGSLLAVFVFLAYWGWRRAREEWNRVSTCFESNAVTRSEPEPELEAAKP